MGLPNYFITTLRTSLQRGGSETQIDVGSITTPDGQVISFADFAQLGVIDLIIDPQSSGTVEYAKATGINPVGPIFTGATRGYSFKDNTQIAANKLYHPVGATVLIGWGTHDISQFMDLHSDQTAGGIKTFTVLPVLPATVPTGLQAASATYVASVVAGASGTATNLIFGTVKLSVAAASGPSPIAVGDNDPRVPTQNENDAMVGTSGSPSSTNKFVCENDTSNGVIFTASTVSFTASTKTISDSGNGFVTANIRPGSSITISGSVANNFTFTVVSVSAGAIVVVETVVDGAAGPAVTLTTVTANKVARRNSTGNVTVPATPSAATDAGSKGYIDGLSVPLAAQANDSINASELSYTYFVNNIAIPNVANGWTVTTWGATGQANGWKVSASGAGGVSLGVIGVGDPAAGNAALTFAATKIVKIKIVTIATTDSFGLSSTNTLGFGLANSSVANIASTSATTRRIGIVFGTSNAATAVVCDGTTVTTGSISGLTNTANTVNVWEIVWTPATPKVEFYLNGVLKATLNTHVPTTSNGAQAQLCIQSSTNQGDFACPEFVISQQV